MNRTTLRKIIKLLRRCREDRYDLQGRYARQSRELLDTRAELELYKDKFFTLYRTEEHTNRNLCITLEFDPRALRSIDNPEQFVYTQIRNRLYAHNILPL